jgi:hypothetical protein
MSRPRFVAIAATVASTSILGLAGCGGSDDDLRSSDEARFAKVFESFCSDLQQFAANPPKGPDVRGLSDAAARRRLNAVLSPYLAEFDSSLRRLQDAPVPDSVPDDFARDLRGFLKVVRSSTSEARQGIEGARSMREELPVLEKFSTSMNNLPEYDTDLPARFYRAAPTCKKLSED